MMSIVGHTTGGISHLVADVSEEAVGIAVDLKIDVAPLRPPAAHELLHASLEREKGDEARLRRVFDLTQLADVRVPTRTVTMEG